MEELLQCAQDSASCLKVLSNPYRLLIMCELSEEPRCVGQLVNLTGLKQSTVSAHLWRLRQSGLVETRREGTQMWYTAPESMALQVVRFLRHYNLSK